MTFLQRIVGVALSALAAGSASATTYQMTGTLSGQEVSNYGNLVLTFDTTGLPITSQADMTAAVSDVNATASIATYYSDDTFVVSGAHGSGKFAFDIGQPYPRDGYSQFTFRSGPMIGELYVARDFDGTGLVFGNDGSVPSFVAIEGAGTADGFYIFRGSSAPVATPEPESLSLLVSGLSASGLAWRMRRRFPGC